MENSHLEQIFFPPYVLMGLIYCIFIFILFIYFTKTQLDMDVYFPAKRNKNNESLKILSETGF